MNVNCIHRKPTKEEYLALRKSCGWPTFEDDIIVNGLERSLFVVVAEDDSGNVVGMGRIVGDGFLYLHIQDVIVMPHCQRRGIGKTIVGELMEYAKHAGGTNTSIGLFSSKGREGFYKNFGFIERPNDVYGPGMILTKK